MWSLPSELWSGMFPTRSKRDLVLVCWLLLFPMEPNPLQSFFWCPSLSSKKTNSWTNRPGLSFSSPGPYLDKCTIRSSKEWEGRGFLSGAGRRRDVRISWGGGSLDEIFRAPRLASQSAMSFPGIPAWPGTQMRKVGMRDLSTWRRCLASLIRSVLSLAFQSPWTVLMAYWLSIKSRTDLASGLGGEI